MKKILLLILMLPLLSTAQRLDLFEKKLYISTKGDTLPYRILYPENFSPQKKYPVVFVLHGAGERGRNNESQLVYGASLFAESTNMAKYPAIVIFPQCPPESYWSSVNITTNDGGKRIFTFDYENPPTVAMTSLMELVDQTLSFRYVNKKQVYVMGLSMGGMGTFEIVYRMPKLFAAAVPICGGGDTRQAGKMTRPEWRIYHGAVDDIVPPKHSEDMYNALITHKKAKATLKIYEGVNHGSWHNVFSEPDLLSWLFSKKK